MKFTIRFVAIMIPEEKILIDTKRPLGNSGYPSSFKGAQHLRKRIFGAEDQIRKSELDALIDSLLE